MRSSARLGRFTPSLLAPKRGVTEKRKSSLSDASQNGKQGIEVSKGEGNELEKRSKVGPNVASRIEAAFGSLWASTAATSEEEKLRISPAGELRNKPRSEERERGCKDQEQKEGGAEDCLDFASLVTSPKAAPLVIRPRKTPLPPSSADDPSPASLDRTFGRDASYLAVAPPSLGGSLSWILMRERRRPIRKTRAEIELIRHHCDDKARLALVSKVFGPDDDHALIALVAERCYSVERGPLPNVQKALEKALGSATEGTSVNKKGTEGKKGRNGGATNGVDTTTEACSSATEQRATPSEGAQEKENTNHSGISEKIEALSLKPDLFIQEGRRLASVALSPLNEEYVSPAALARALAEVYRGAEVSAASSSASPIARTHSTPMQQRQAAVVLSLWISETIASASELIKSVATGRVSKRDQPAVARYLITCIEGILQTCAIFETDTSLEALLAVPERKRLTDGVSAGFGALCAAFLAQTVDAKNMVNLPTRSNLMVGATNVSTMKDLRGFSSPSSSPNTYTQTGTRLQLHESTTEFLHTIQNDEEKSGVKEESSETQRDASVVPREQMVDYFFESAGSKAVIAALIEHTLTSNLNMYRFMVSAILSGCGLKNSHITEIELTTISERLLENGITPDVLLSSTAIASMRPELGIVFVSIVTRHCCKNSWKFVLPVNESTNAELVRSYREKSEGSYQATELNSLNPSKIRSKQTPILLLPPVSAETLGMFRREFTAHRNAIRSLASVRALPLESRLRLVAEMILHGHPQEAVVLARTHVLEMRFLITERTNTFREVPLAEYCIESLRSVNAIADVIGGYYTIIKDTCGLSGSASDPPFSTSSTRPSGPSADLLTIPAVAEAFRRLEAVQSRVREGFSEVAGIYIAFLNDLHSRLLMQARSSVASAREMTSAGSGNSTSTSSGSNSVTVKTVTAQLEEIAVAIRPAVCAMIGIMSSVDLEPSSMVQLRPLLSHSLQALGLDIQEWQRDLYRKFEKENEKDQRTTKKNATEESTNKQGEIGSNKSGCIAALAPRLAYVNDIDARVQKESAAAIGQWLSASFEYFVKDVREKVVDLSLVTSTLSDASCLLCTEANLRVAGLYFPFLPQGAVRNFIADLISNSLVRTYFHLTSATLSGAGSTPITQAFITEFAVGDQARLFFGMSAAQNGSFSQQRMHQLESGRAATLPSLGGNSLMSSSRESSDGTAVQPPSSQRVPNKRPTRGDNLHHSSVLNSAAAGRAGGGDTDSDEDSLSILQKHVTSQADLALSVVRRNSMFLDERGGRGGGGEGQGTGRLVSSLTASVSQSGIVFGDDGPQSTALMRDEERDALRRYCISTSMPRAQFLALISRLAILETILPTESEQYELKRLKRVLLPIYAEHLRAMLLDVTVNGNGESKTPQHKDVASITFATLALLDGLRVFESTSYSLDLAVPAGSVASSIEPSPREERLTSTPRPASRTVTVSAAEALIEWTCGALMPLVIRPASELMEQRGSDNNSEREEQQHRQQASSIASVEDRQRLDSLCTLIGDLLCKVAIIVERKKQRDSVAMASASGSGVHVAGATTSSAAVGSKTSLLHADASAPQKGNDVDLSASSSRKKGKKERKGKKQPSPQANVSHEMNSSAHSEAAKPTTSELLPPFVMQLNEALATYTALTSSSLSSSLSASTINKESSLTSKPVFFRSDTQLLEYLLMLRRATGGTYDEVTNLAKTVHSLCRRVCADSATSLRSYFAEQTAKIRALELERIERRREKMKTRPLKVEKAKQVGDAVLLKSPGYVGVTSAEFQRNIQSTWPERFAVIASVTDLLTSTVHHHYQSDASGSPLSTSIPVPAGGAPINANNKESHPPQEGDQDNMSSTTHSLIYDLHQLICSSPALTEFSIEDKETRQWVLNQQARIIPIVEENASRLLEDERGNPLMTAQQGAVLLKGLRAVYCEAVREEAEADAIRAATGSTSPSSSSSDAASPQKLPSALFILRQMELICASIFVHRRHCTPADVACFCEAIATSFPSSVRNLKVSQSGIARIMNEIRSELEKMGSTDGGVVPHPTFEAARELASKLKSPHQAGKEKAKAKDGSTPHSSTSSAVVSDEVLTSLSTSINTDTAMRATFNRIGSRSQVSFGYQYTDTLARRLSKAQMMAFAASEETRSRQMSMFVPTVIALRASMNPKDCVACLKALVIANVQHNTCFGILFQRMGEVSSSFDVDTVVDLVNCANLAKENANDNLQKLCHGAAQPIIRQVIFGLLSNNADILLTPLGKKIIDAVATACPNDPAADQILVAFSNLLSTTQPPVESYVAVLRLIRSKNYPDPSAVNALRMHLLRTVLSVPPPPNNGSRCMTSADSVTGHFSSADYNINEVLHLFSLLVQVGARDEALFEQLQVITGDRADEVSIEGIVHVCRILQVTKHEDKSLLDALLRYYFLSAPIQYDNKAARLCEDSGNNETVGGSSSDKKGAKMLISDTQRERLSALVGALPPDDLTLLCTTASSVLLSGNNVKRAPNAFQSAGSTTFSTPPRLTSPTAANHHHSSPLAAKARQQRSVLSALFSIVLPQLEMRVQQLNLTDLRAIISSLTGLGALRKENEHGHAANKQPVIVPASTSVLSHMKRKEGEKTMARGQVVDLAVAAADLHASRCAAKFVESALTRLSNERVGDLDASAALLLLVPLMELGVGFDTIAALKRRNASSSSSSSSSPEEVSEAAVAQVMTISRLMDHVFSVRRVVQGRQLLLQRLVDAFEVCEEAREIHPRLYEFVKTNS